MGCSVQHLQSGKKNTELFRKSKERGHPMARQRSRQFPDRHEDHIVPLNDEFVDFLSFLLIFTFNQRKPHAAA